MKIDSKTKWLVIKTNEIGAKVLTKIFLRINSKLTLTYLCNTKNTYRKMISISFDNLSSNNHFNTLLPHLHKTIINQQIIIEIKVMRIMLLNLHMSNTNMDQAMLNHLNLQPIYMEIKELIILIKIDLIFRLIWCKIHLVLIKISLKIDLISLTICSQIHLTITNPTISQ